MEDLLFEEFPPTPPGTGLLAKKAIVLKYNWTYDDNANHVPPPIRNRVPDHFKRDGKLYLSKGAEGYLYETSPNQKCGMAVFLIRSSLIHVAVPINYLEIGLDFASLSLKKTKISQHIPIKPTPATPFSAHHGNLMDSFITGIWLALRSKVTDLQPLSAGLDLSDFYFGSDFHDSIAAIISGFVPEARRVFQNGNFTVNDILTIPKVTRTWPQGHTIYIRLYYSEANPSTQGAIYVGKTNDLWSRDGAHNRATYKASGRHYAIARRFAPEDHHMIPICFWGHDVPPNVLAMAEQTAVLLFNTYMEFATDPTPQTPIFLSFRRIQFMRALIDDIQRTLPWTPPIRLIGLNTETPMICTKVHRYISAIPNLQSNDGTGTFTRYRTPARFSLRGQQSSIHFIRLKHQNGSMHTSVIIPEADVTSMEIPSHGFLVFEIMDNGQPHPNPWIRCPAVGLYEDFIQASSLGIRFEWYNESQNTWLSTTLHRATAGITQASWANNANIALTGWQTSMSLIQALKGIVYLNFQPNQGFYERLTFGAIKVMQLQTDHLEQTYQWIPRPEILQTFPQKATWQYNFSAMTKQFSSLTTFMPTGPLSHRADLHRYNPTGDGYGATKYKTKCDFCVLSGISGIIPCKPDDSSPYGNGCTLCLLFNRPCSFTRRSDLSELWGTDEPHLHPLYSLAKYPTGPLRFLAFHLTRSQGMRRISEPREISLGLFLRRDLDNEEEDGDVEMDG